MLVRTLDSALQMFEAFADHGRPMTLSELSRLLEIPTSTCFGLMRTMQARGYLYEVGGRKTFYPTARWLTKAREIGRHDPVLEILHPLLEQLRDGSEETVILSKRLGDAVVYVDVLESKRTVRYAAEIGQLKSLNLTSSGKALLGAMPEHEREAALLRLHTATGARLNASQRTQLKEDLAQFSKTGWFIGRGETSMDVMGIAVPVTVAGDLFAIAIAGPLSRMDPRLTAHAKQLLSCARAIARKL